MKSFLLLVSCLSATILPQLIFAAPASFPTEWKLQLFNMPTVRKLTVPEKKSLTAAEQQYRQNSDMFDFDKFKPAANSAYLSASWVSDSDREVYLGADGYVFAIKLNGVVIYDFLNKGLGNDIRPLSVGEHIIKLDLKKGTNEIAIFSRSTNWGLDYCYGTAADRPWAVKIQEIPAPSQPKPALAEPEMLLRPEPDKIRIHFLANIPCAAAVEYREAGTNVPWMQEFDLAGDLLLRRNTLLHKVKLTGLKPDTEYEYRFLFLELPLEKNGFIRPMFSNITAREHRTPIKKFRTLKKDNLRFFVYGDTQPYISKTCLTVEDRRVLMKKLLTLPEYKNADFVINIGDAGSYTHNIRKDLIQELFNLFAPASGEVTKPLVYVRGNHEANGIDAEKWYDFFTMPDEKTYYSFSAGEIFFIVLDCGDLSKSPRPVQLLRNGAMLHMTNLHRKQKEFLRQTFASDAYKRAKVRIVLSHADPQIPSELKLIRDLVTEEVIPQMQSAYPLHLWIAGHTHTYRRSAAGSTHIVQRKKRNFPHALPTAPVNWVSVDAPDLNKIPDFSYLDISINGSLITVNAIDESGKLFDKFTIDGNGKTVELFSGEELKKFPVK